MPNIAGLNNPGLAAFLASRQQATTDDNAQVQRASALMQILGAAQQQQQRDVEMRRQSRAMDALSGLPADATTGTLLQALRPHMSPDKLVPLLQGEENKRLMVDAQKEAIKGRLAQHARDLDFKYEQLSQKATDAQQKMALDQWYKSNRLALDNEGLKLTGARVYYETGERPTVGVPLQPPPQRGPVGATPTAPGVTMVTGQETPLAAPSGDVLSSTNFNPAKTRLSQGQPPVLDALMEEVAALVQASQTAADPTTKDLKLSQARELAQALQARGVRVNIPELNAVSSPTTTTPTRTATSPSQTVTSAEGIPEDILAITSPKDRNVAIAKWRSDKQKREGGREDAFAKATYTAGLAEVKKDEQNLANVAQLETALKRWSEVSPSVMTGRVTGLIPAVGQPERQELIQLQNYLGMNNFKPGQGQISNFERSLIKGAGPNVTNDKETNDRIVQIQLGGVQNARDRAAFREAYLEVNKKLLGADKKWNDYIEKNPRYIPSPEGRGAIIANPRRTEWTEWFKKDLSPQGSVAAPASPTGWSIRPLD